MATTTGGLAQHPARRPTLAQLDPVWANLVRSPRAGDALAPWDSSEPVADADNLDEHVALVR